MRCVNNVHDFDDHDLRGIVRASRFSYKGVILGVFFNGKFYSESSVILVKLDGRKDWDITPYRKNSVHGFHERATVEHLFLLYSKNRNSGIRTCGWEKVHGVITHGC
jgi:hypothetical protein